MVNKKDKVKEKKMSDKLLKISAPLFPSDSEGNTYATSEMIIKFAELVIAETLKVTTENMGYSESIYVKNRVKEHFGLE